MPLIIIYVTFPNQKEGEKITRHLLDKKLIACVNFFPITSSYLWKGKIEQGNEIVGLLKSQEKNWNKIKKEIKKLHSYKIPCIIKMKIDVNEEYEKWVREEC